MIVVRPIQETQMINEFRGETRWLSNFHEAPFIWNYHIWKTTEHAYQAAKTLNPDAFMAVLLCDTPGQAKNMGQSVPLREDWDDIKLRIMHEVNFCKYTQNDYLKDALLATEEEELIEGNNWGDTFWGVCNNYGHNHLGKTLMKIRTELKFT